MGRYRPPFALVEVAVGRDDDLKAGVEQGRVEQVVVALAARGLREPDQPERFAVSLPDPLDPLEHRAVVQADLLQVVVASARAKTRAGSAAGSHRARTPALVGAGRCAGAGTAVRWTVHSRSPWTGRV